jgi:hypothetical protein
LEHKERRSSESRSWLTQPRFLAMGSIFLVGLAAVGIFLLHGKASHKESPTAAHSSKASPTPAPVSLASLPNGVVLDHPKGMGTTQFSAAGDWGFDWSYDCSKLGHPGNFIVSVYDAKGRVSADTPPVIQFGPKGMGVTQYHKPGTYFLGVDTKCDWHITAKATPAQQ